MSILPFNEGFLCVRCCFIHMRIQKQDATSQCSLTGTNKRTCASCSCFSVLTFFFLQCSLERSKYFLAFVYLVLFWK